MLLHFLRRISFFILFLHDGQAAHFYEKRKALEEEIRRSATCKRIINIYGLSGMGKSVLARMFMHHLKKNNQTVLWFDWDKGSIHEQIENCQKKLRIVRSSPLKNVFVFIDKYNSETTTLMEKDLDKVFAMKNARFILTNNRKIKGIRNIYVPPFTQKESLSLMKRYFPKEDKEKLERVTASLGHYPYVITTLCRFVKESMTYTVERIEEMIEKDPTSLIKKDIFAHEEMGHKAVRKMIGDIKKTDPEVYDVLCFLSLLSAKSIPLKLIHHYVGSEDKADKVLEKIDKNAFIAAVHKDSDFIPL